MLSWNLAEKREGTTWVCGKVVSDERDSRRRKKRMGEDGSVLPDEEDDDDDESDDDAIRETLEVWLQLVEVRSVALHFPPRQRSDSLLHSQRPSFTQTQFLTSLRSFANPAAPSSDRASSPPRRREPQQSSFSSSSTNRPILQRPPSQLSGDPVKKKRPRTDPRLSGGSSSFPAPLLPAPAPPPPQQQQQQLALPVIDPNVPLHQQDPRLLALLSHLIPSLAAQQSHSTAQPTRPISTSANHDAIAALRASLGPSSNSSHGIDIDVSEHGTAPTSTADTKGKGRAMPPPSLPPSSSAPMGGSKGKKSGRDEEYVAIEQGDSKGKSNPLDPNGCFNCKRKKSTVWRQKVGESGQRSTVCNGESARRTKGCDNGFANLLDLPLTACGVFYNKHGHHRSGKNERTSPVRQQDSAQGSKSSSGGRPLQGRLTATCESDLKKVKAKKVVSHAHGSARMPGMLPPPSPSKVIGPSSRSPGTNFGLWSTSGRGIMTSPARSPRRGHRNAAATAPHFGLATTSPVRGSYRPPGGGVGLRSGYESDGDGRGNSLSFNALFRAPGSPSPQRTNSSSGQGAKPIPAYLLTASPGTALDRILNDTNIDINSFDMPMPDAVESSERHEQEREEQRRHVPMEDEGADDDEHDLFRLGDQEGLDHALSLYLQSMSPIHKENARPPLGGDASANKAPRGLFDGMLESTNSTIDPATSTSVFAGLAATSAPPTTDVEFDSLLSSLRRDFSTRLSSNALTAPSSPLDSSSPCVQPRTSSATPGQKSKAPQSCGRPAPSILHSFIDGLVPALALQTEDGVGQEATPASDDDPWAPASPSEDATMTLEGFAASLRRVAADEASTSSTAVTSTDANKSSSNAYDLSHLLMLPTKTSRQLVPSHLIATSDVGYDFDGSLPPSSPPLLPSEAFPTPSEFDSVSGITPEELGLDMDDDEQRGGVISGGEVDRLKATLLAAMSGSTGTNEDEGSKNQLSALLSKLGALSDGAGAGANDKVSLDRSTVNKLLEMMSRNQSQQHLSARVGTTASNRPSPVAAPTPPPIRPSSSTEPATSGTAATSEGFDLFGDVGEKGHRLETEQEQSEQQQQDGDLSKMYASLFSEAAGFD